MPGSTPESATAEAPGVSMGPGTGSPRGRRLVHRLLRSPAGALGVVLTVAVSAVAILADVLSPGSPFQPVGPPLAEPSWDFPMGTDDLGRDLLAGIIHGARTSLLVAVLVGLVALAIGVVVGTVSGYRGGLVDDALMRLTELFQVLPRFFLAIVVIAVFGPGIDRLILVLGLTSWAMLARVVRAEVMSLRQREFVEASIASGASAARVVVREIMPNALPAVVVFLGLLVAQVILLEASLGFIGLGDPSNISWGYLAGQAQRFLRVAWWMSFFPGMAIVLAVLGFNLLGDATNDVLGGRR